MSLLKPFLALSIFIAGAVSVGDTVNASTEALSVVLEQQPESVKARYPHRNPRETIEFFDIKPGMVVVEALPGSGWYSRILSPYLGQQGVVIGAMYALSLIHI